MKRLALALAALLIAAGTLAAPAEARGRCHVWLGSGGQPTACRPHYRTWSGHRPPLGLSLTDGCAGVRRESCPAAGADLTSSVTVRSQRKAVGRVAHARTGGTYTHRK